MADSSDSFQLVSVAEACRILNVSDSTLRRLLRAGRLEAQKVERPQGHVWLVKVPAPTGTSSEDPPNRLGAADSHPPAAPPADAMVSLIQTTIATVLGPLVGQLDAQRQTIERQGETIRDQAETIGRQSAELERAASIAVKLSDELEVVKAENRALVARTEAQPVTTTNGASLRPAARPGAMAAGRAGDRRGGAGAWPR